MQASDVMATNVITVTLDTSVQDFGGAFGPTWYQRCARRGRGECPGRHRQRR